MSDMPAAPPYFGGDDACHNTSALFNCSSEVRGVVFPPLLGGHRRPLLLVAVDEERHDGRAIVRRAAVLPQHQIICSQFFQSRKDEPVTLGDLIQIFTSKQVPVQTLYSLLFWGALEFDLMQPLDRDSRITMPSSSALTALKRKTS